MPEESFEEAARRLAERFSLEPKPEIWQEVEAAIAPEKKRRRILVWSWLLPLCAAGGLAALFIHHKKSSPVEQVVSVSSDRKMILPENENNTITKNESKKKERSFSSDKISRTKRDDAEKIINKKNGSKIFLERNKVSHVKTDSDETYNGQVWNGSKKSDADTELSYSSLQIKKGITKAGDNVIANNTDINDNQFLLQERKNIISPSDNNGDNDSVIFLPPSARSLPGAVTANTQTDTTANTIAAGVLKDSLRLQNETKPVVLTKKRTDKYAWQLGVLAEAGVSSWGNNLFRIFGNSAESKSNDNMASPTEPSGGLSNGADSMSSAAAYQHTRKGLDAGLGITAKKDIAHHLYISGQLAYRYQEYGVDHFVRYSQFISNQSFLSVNYASGSEIYHHHFANLFTGIGWQFLTVKKIGLSIETGIDNSWLITLKQHKGNLSPAQFSSDIVERHTARDFYRWQPQANVSLPVSFAGKNIHLQVAPFARFGLRSFQKGGASYAANHLVSAGLQAVYFF